MCTIVFIDQEPASPLYYQQPAEIPVSIFLIHLHMFLKTRL
jgi:hypothetical protein